MVCRLDLWHRARVRLGDLPAECRDRSLEQIQIDLGMGLSARQGRPFRMRFRSPVEYRRQREGLSLLEWWDTPRGTLHRRSVWTADEAELEMVPRIDRWPITSREDYFRYEEIVRHLEFEPTLEESRAHDARIGSHGLPLGMIGANPMHDLMLSWVGYEQLYLDLADMPDVVSSAAEAGNRAYERMWPIVAESPFEMVMHGVNFDSATTPPGLFREHFLPYLRRFNRMMHAAGKKTVFHGDGDQSHLLDLLVEAEDDVADCLAVSPLGKLTLDRAMAVWRGRITVWGGMPSPLLEARVSDAEFDAHLSRLAQAADAGGFILGISDQAMPASLWSRLRAMGRFGGR